PFAKRGVRNRLVRSVSANAGRKESNLRQLLRFWLWRELVSEFTCISQSLLLPRSWSLQLTPITLFAVIGMWLLRKPVDILGLYSISSFVAFRYLIGFYQDWDGLSSFGNPFFLSLTVLFVIGLAGLIDCFARAWNPRRTWLVAQAATIILVIWNFGLI